MKKLGVAFLCLCLIPLAAALVEVQAPDTMPLLIVGSDNESVSYRLTLTNEGVSDDFQIYSLVGVTLSPSTIHLESDNPITLTLTATPIDRLLKSTRGAVKFEYEIYSTLNGATRKELLFDIAELSDVILVRPVSIQPGDASATLSIQNLKRERFSNLKLEMDSELINTETVVTLEPFQIINITVPIDQNSAKKLVAGTYPLQINAEYNGAEDEFTGSVKYLEKGGVAVAESREGVVIRTKITEKINEGNVPVTVTITERRDIFTRLLTNHDPAPETSSKRGFYVAYTWQKLLAPSERLTVRSTTNYTLPLVILIIILVILGGVKLYLRTPVNLVKRVSFVRTKGGEFALKVTIHAKARKSLQNLSITDRIPHAMKLYESFGIKPHEVNEGARTITWNMAHMNAGEERVFSYVMYSKLKVVGSFELPLAHARFHHENKAGSVFSNKTTFVADFGKGTE